MTVINVVIVWICWVPIAEFGTYLKNKDPALPDSIAYFASSLCVGFTFVNGFLGHVVPTLTGNGYNPGFLTSLLLFVPFAVWVMYTHVYKAFGKNVRLVVLCIA